MSPRAAAARAANAEAPRQKQQADLKKACSVCSQVHGKEKDILLPKLRDHVAAHILVGDVSSSACGYCGKVGTCSSTLGKGTAKGIVRPVSDCPCYFKFNNKAVHKAAERRIIRSTNAPMLCTACPKPTYIWKYGMLHHWQAEHAGRMAEFPADYCVGEHEAYGLIRRMARRGQDAAAAGSASAMPEPCDLPVVVVPDGGPGPGPAPGTTGNAAAAAAGARAAKAKQAASGTITTSGSSTSDDEEQGDLRADKLSVDRCKMHPHPRPEVAVVSPPGGVGDADGSLPAAHGAAAAAAAAALAECGGVTRTSSSYSNPMLPAPAPVAQQAAVVAGVVRSGGADGGMALTAAALLPSQAAELAATLSLEAHVMGLGGDKAAALMMAGGGEWGGWCRNRRARGRDQDPDGCCGGASDDGCGHGGPPRQRPRLQGPPDFWDALLDDMSSTQPLPPPQQQQQHDAEALAIRQPLHPNGDDDDDGSGGPLLATLARYGSGLSLPELSGGAPSSAAAPVQHPLRAPLQDRALGMSFGMKWAAQPPTGNAGHVASGISDRSGMDPRLSALELLPCIRPHAHHAHAHAAHSSASGGPNSPTPAQPAEAGCAQGRYGYGGLSSFGETTHITYTGNGLALPAAPHPLQLQLGHAPTAHTPPAPAAGAAAGAELSDDDRAAYDFQFGATARCNYLAAAAAEREVTRPQQQQQQQQLLQRAEDDDDEQWSIMALALVGPAAADASSETWQVVAAAPRGRQLPTMLQDSGKRAGPCFGKLSYLDSSSVPDQRKQLAASSSGSCMPGLLHPHPHPHPASAGAAPPLASSSSSVPWTRQLPDGALVSFIPHSLVHGGGWDGADDRAAAAAAAAAAALAAAERRDAAQQQERDLHVHTQLGALTKPAPCAAALPGEGLRPRAASRTLLPPAVGMPPAAAEYGPYGQQLEQAAATAAGASLSPSPRNALPLLQAATVQPLRVAGFSFLGQQQQQLLQHHEQQQQLHHQQQQQQLQQQQQQQHCGLRQDLAACYGGNDSQWGLSGLELELEGRSSSSGRPGHEQLLRRRQSAAAVAQALHMSDAGGCGEAAPPPPYNVQDTTYTGVCNMRHVYDSLML